MSSGMSFQGVYKYSDSDALEGALVEVRAFLADVDVGNFKATFDLPERRELELVVAIDHTCPSGWYDLYTAIFETLAAHAIDGVVNATIADEDGVESFPACAPDEP